MPLYLYPLCEKFTRARACRYKDRAERLVLAKVDLAKLEAACEECKKEFDESMDRFRDKELAKTFEGVSRFAAVFFSLLLFFSTLSDGRLSTRACGVRASVGPCACSSWLEESC